MSNTVEVPGVSLLPMPTETGYLDTIEAAQFLRLSKKTLEKMRVEGCGPRFLKAGKGIRAKVLYRPADLRAWVEEVSYASTSEYAKSKA